MGRSGEILAALKGRDQEAVRAFFTTYYDVLVLFATSILKDADAAEDVVQECFVKVWEKKSFDRLTDGLDRYMFHLVKNAALNALRGNRRRNLRHEQAGTEVNPTLIPDENDEQEEMRILYTAIHQLPPERRRIFMMVCAKGMKYQDVADTLGISINTVRTQMGRSVKFLREQLKGHVFTSLLFFWLKVNRQLFS